MTAHMGCRFRTKDPLYPFQKVNRVGIIVAGYDIEWPATADTLPCTVHQNVHCPSGALVLGIFAAVLVAPAGIDEMGQIELVDTFIVAQTQKIRQAFVVALGQGEAQPDLDAT